MRFIRHCLSAFFLLFYSTVFAQQEREYAFTHFSTSSGLVSNTVYDMVQDKQGYMWLATVDGLQRYDGNRFITFRHSNADPQSIPADNLVQLTEDKNDNLWIYAGDKIGFFDTKISWLFKYFFMCYRPRNASHGNCQYK